MTEYTGLVEDITATTIYVSKKCLFIPLEARKKVTDLNLAVGTKVRVMYDTKGNLTDLIPTGDNYPSFVPAGELTQKVTQSVTPATMVKPPATPPVDTMHMHPATAQGLEPEYKTAPQTPAIPPVSQMHMQKDDSPAKSQTVDESELYMPKTYSETGSGNLTGTSSVEFCVSRATELVISHWGNKPDANLSLSDKVANIKLVSDALLDYMNQKGSGQK